MIVNRLTYFNFRYIFLNFIIYYKFIEEYNFISNHNINHNLFNLLKSCKIKSDKFLFY